MRGRDNNIRGKIGEEIGRKYMLNLGFKPIHSNIFNLSNILFKRKFTCFDDYMCKNGIKYYVEYKSKELKGNKFDYILELTTREQSSAIEEIIRNNIPFILVATFFKNNKIYNVEHFTHMRLGHHLRSCRI